MRECRTLWRWLLVLSLWLAAPGLGHGGDGAVRQQCGTAALSGVASPASGTGGIYLPAAGVLRVLVVFASFPDDETAHLWWPAHQPPLFMDQFIDPDTATRSSGDFNLSRYFREMSLGSFHLIGEAIWVESRQSQEEYRLSGSYGHANMDILPDRVDSLVDFSRYDNWTRRGDYDHANVPDSVVDMIVMVWRTAMFEYLGEASLGYKPAIHADGKRIEMGYPAYLPMPNGSGVTCEYPYGDDPRQVMKTMAHEVGHWLLGMYHPYNGLKPDGKFQFWGILCPGQRASSCANAYDRERLGWIAPVLVTPGTTLSLDDFLTTGAAAKYHPANGEEGEYFYLENHQRRSPFDDVTANPLDRGLWILHQQGPYLEMDNLRIHPSDGNWEWIAASDAASCFGATVPVFSRGSPRVARGLSHRDQLTTPTSSLNWMLATRGPGGALTCGEFYAGTGFRGAFDTSTSAVFSPASNPATLTWSSASAGVSCEVVGEHDGVLSVEVAADGDALSPARRFLGMDPSGVPAAAGEVRLAWGDQWSEGQTLESDVTGSELQRSTADDEGWVSVYSGPATSWNDASLPYDTTGTALVRFRVRVRDSEGKRSRWSNEYIVRSAMNTAADDCNVTPVSAYLDANYPNPFNPTTTIRFALPSRQTATLAVFDVLGRCIRTLFNGTAPAGTQSVVWDGTDDAGREAAGGVYLYRLTATGYSATRAMLMLR